MAEKRIPIACKGNSEAKYCDLIPLQGNLKSLSESNYERLKKQILELGFSEPISVWKDGDSLRILNGHQRLRTIKTMVEKEGYRVGPLPISLVEAKNVDEAKRKILALTSQYGKIEDEGLYEFLQDTDIAPNTLDENYSFPEVNLNSFVTNYFEASEPPIDDQKDLDPNMGDEVKMIKCPNCGTEFPA